MELHVLRLDEIHPVVSGNKLFKLHYYINEAKINPGSQVITYGGAYSNHLAATAYTCHNLGIPTTGIVRGQRPGTLSHTLQYCHQMGMDLKFISREAYTQQNDEEAIAAIHRAYNNAIIIPEGGYSSTGAAGAEKITSYINEKYTHICCACGTATTIAGILMGAAKQQVIAVPVLKGITDIEKRIIHLTNNKSLLQQLHIAGDYHFGGYAKYNGQLLQFMNQLYNAYKLPTDFVYTGKLMYAVFKLIENDFFTPGSNIIAIHTGGLQGNLSLAPGSLTF